MGGPLCGDRASGQSISAESDPHVAVVVLSWNGREHTLECLRSLERVEWSRLTVIVVDNGSDDGTSEAVRERHPDALLIRSDHNVGASAGNNIGLRRALALGAEYVLVLNNDTVVDPDVVRELVGEASERPDAGAVCATIYFRDPPDLIWCAGGGTFDPDRGRSGRMRGYRERDAGQFSSVAEVERGTGAALLMRADALRDVGLFDPRLFVHVEDVDWSLRARRAGYRLYSAPSAKVWHVVSASSGGEHSALITYYSTRNHLEVSRRYARPGRLATVRRNVVIVAVHIAHIRRSRKRVAHLRAVWRGVRDYRRRAFGPGGG